MNRRRFITLLGRRGGVAVGGSRASDKQDTSGRNYQSG
jgi:general stress protein YciG